MLTAEPKQTYATDIASSLTARAADEVWLREPLKKRRTAVASKDKELLDAIREDLPALVRAADVPGTGGTVPAL